MYTCLVCLVLHTGMCGKSWISQAGLSFTVGTFTEWILKCKFFISFNKVLFICYKFNLSGALGENKVVPKPFAKIIYVTKQVMNIILSTVTQVQFCFSWCWTFNNIRGVCRWKFCKRMVTVQTTEISTATQVSAVSESRGTDPNSSLFL